MKRLLTKNNETTNIKSILENLDSFCKWLVNSKYADQLKKKMVWPLLIDFDYEGSELQPIANIFYDVEYELANIDEETFKEEYGSLEVYLTNYIHDLLLELKDADQSID